MRILFLLVVLSVTSALQSQVVIKENAIQSKYAFPLVTSKAKAVVVYDTDDYPRKHTIVLPPKVIIISGNISYLLFN